MAYTQRYAGGFVDKPTLTTPIDSAFLNAVETALLKLLGADGTVDGQALQWIQAQSKFGPALLLNKNVDPAAAIASSKIDFTGGNALTNAAIAGAAAISRSKLDFGSGLVNADISAAAAIALSKLAGYPSSSSSVPRGDGTWGVPNGVTYGQTVSGANTDLAWFGGSSFSFLLELQTGGGTLRSIGAPTIASARLTIYNTASAITILQNTAGGTGLPFTLNGSQNKVLHANESIEFVSDGGFWREVTYNPIEITGLLPASGTTPTAGSGFTYTHTNSTAIYAITFSPVLASTPIILAQQLSGSISVSGISANGFTATTQGASDQIWWFRAMPAR